MCEVSGSPSLQVPVTDIGVDAFAAFLVGGAFGVALILMRRAGRKTPIPFGPFMLAGAWIGILFGETLAGWYLGLFAIA